jgi:hypothetical protein
MLQQLTTAYDMKLLNQGAKHLRFPRVSQGKP